MRGALIDVGGMVLERHDAPGILEPQRLAEGGVQHVGAHAGVVLVDKAPVCAHEDAVARLRARRRFSNVDQLRRSIAEYIRYYNHDRIKLKLKGLSPVQYRTQPKAT
ncbi:Integrase core domain protein [compost metagenome]